jgi:hypothetical protein
MSRAKEQAELLGQSFGSANSRLRKNIIFHLLERLGENVCYVCGEVIEVSDDLSVEHIKPWEKRSAELFWALDNIAFSHRKCNRPHSGGEKRRIESPEGKAWCGSCRQHRDREDFGKKHARWNGLQPYCRDCKKESDARYYRG